MGPGDLQQLIEPLTDLAARGDDVVVGPQSGDDAGVFRLDGHTLVATADFITPVCDDPRRFGHVAAANSLSDVYAMGGEPLFALNLCCFPGVGIPDGVLDSILAGAAETLGAAGAALLGGHSVTDEELKFGLAVVGRVEAERLLSNDRAEPGQRLVLTKPLGTGVLINAFKAGKIDEDALEPVLVEMERLNDRAARLALEHGATAATDITGFGFGGHALNVARGSGVGLRVRFDALPVHDRFYELVGKGVSTGCTGQNRDVIEERLTDDHDLADDELELLADPQTSGGLLVTVPAERSADLVGALVNAGHTATEVGEVGEGPPELVIR